MVIIILTLKSRKPELRESEKENQRHIAHNLRNQDLNPDLYVSKIVLILSRYEGG